ncbi:KGG domain-containing protein [Sodalis endosymbiont of Spalangia cameroni]|uniref:general stress protein n=1 Tax=Sodalis praecaptivus TaxID=1239307 RepID=UPI0031F88BDC
MAEHRGGSGNFAEDKQKASEAGRKGGQSSSSSGGNFKNDPQKASEAGKKGGQHSHSGGRNS